MARKSATSRVTTPTHATRARMSLEPDKRVCALLETTPPLALFPSISGRFMLLSLTQERRTTQRLRERFLPPQPYHITPPIMTLRFQTKIDRLVRCKRSHAQENA